MSKWQTEIYRGELGQTIKAEYRSLLAAKKSEADAESIIVDYCMCKLVSSSEDEGRMWLALALRQWEHGRLSFKVKEKALEWCHRSVAGISIDALKMLQSTLESSMPEKKRIPLPPWVKKCPWPVGGLLAYRIISHNHGKVKNSPYWGKYVLLRIIKIVRQPVTWLAPDAECSESMLVGLYNWCGDKIPEPSIVDTLDFTPIAIMEPSLPQTSLSRIRPDIIQAIGVEHLKQLQDSVIKPRVETCCCLDWICVSGINRKEVFTYLGCDPDYHNKIPDFFKTEITDYSMSHSIPFDATLYNRLTQLNKTTD